MFTTYKENKINLFIYLLIKASEVYRQLKLQVYLVFENTFFMAIISNTIAGRRNGSSGNGRESLSGGNDSLGWWWRLSCGSTGQNLPKKAREFVGRRWRRRKTITVVGITHLSLSLSYYSLCKSLYVAFCNNLLTKVIGGEVGRVISRSYSKRVGSSESVSGVT